MFAELAAKLRGFEERPGQVAMAQAVAETLAKGGALAVEAPCGIGKTFAYLVPAIRHAMETESRVVVCTANIALQEQIIAKDLPALSKAVGLPFRTALIKGIGNYLCLDRFHDTRGELTRITFDKREIRHWNQVMDWAGSTKSGDISDLDFEPLDGVWGRVNGVPELCTGSECRYYEDCHAMNARRLLREAHVIVTNYHLFFAHLRVKMAAERDVILPPYSAVICDEAHEMADIARDFFGLRLTPFSILTLVRGANRFRLRHVADRLRAESKRFFAEVEKFSQSGRYRARLRKPGFAEGEELLSAVVQFGKTLGDLESATEEESEKDKVKKYRQAAEHYADSLERFLRLDDPNMVYSIERSGSLVSRLIDPSALLREQLFASSTVVLTSATLAPFELLRRETGAEFAERTVPSPFDFREQAALVVPKMRTRPSDSGFLQELAEGIRKILEIMRGRTMCLFTSYRNLEFCADDAESTGVKILRQGDRPRTKLLEKFRKDPESALFATASFWQGVDIPGEALSCLAIDKLPFLPPDDPLLDAIQERDPECFARYSLPKAILSLRQGFGRLIRTRTDRGVVVIFDRRIVDARYGRDFLAALPECPLTRDLATLEEFFRSTPRES